MTTERRGSGRHNSQIARSLKELDCFIVLLVCFCFGGWRSNVLEVAVKNRRALLLLWAQAHGMWKNKQQAPHERLQRVQRPLWAAVFPPK